MSTHGEPRGMDLWELTSPGLVAALVGIDAGGLLTYSFAGARFGPGMAWLVPPLVLALVLVHELAVRLGTVTGKGTSDLIRERFGVRWTCALLAALWLANVGTMLAQFAGVAAAAEIFGLSRYLAVPAAAAGAWMLALRVERTWIERAFLAALVGFVVYFAAAALTVGAAVVPRPGPPPGWIGYPGMALALVGAVLAPWTVFYLQGAVVDQQIQVRDRALVRRGVVAGAAIVGALAIAVILTCAAGLFVPGVRLLGASEAALALAPLLGPWAAPAFAVLLLAASLFAACTLPLVTAVAIGDALGFPSGPEHTPGEAPAFYVIYTATIALAAGLVLVPGPKLLSIMLGAEVANGVLVPGVLVALALLAGRKRLMGEQAVGGLARAAVWGLGGLVALLALVALVAAVS